MAYTRFLANGLYEVWIARIDGSGNRRLAAGSSPRISPDGRRIVYQGECQPRLGCGGLYLIASSGGQPRVLASRGGDAQWSPDGKGVVFSDGSSLVRVKVATGRRDAVAPASVQWGGSFSFSPSGNEIAYSLSHRGHCFSGTSVDIYVVNVGGGAPRRLTTDGCSAFPVWGEGGIAFARLIPHRTGEGFFWGRHEIWRINPDGTGRRTITGRLPTRLLGQGITGLVPIAWSDDGRRLLAGLQTEFGDIPFAIDPERGTLRRIDCDGVASVASSLDLSRDGRYVLVSEEGVASDDQSRVTSIAYTGGCGRVIARRAAAASWNR